MEFAHDTQVVLAAAAALVNTATDGTDALADAPSFEAWVDGQPYTGERTHTAGEHAAVRALRERIGALWPAPGSAEPPDRDRTVELVNEILTETDARPRLARHDGWDWHLHVTPRDAPLADRMGAEIAMAIVELVRADDLSRLRRCAGEDCDAVLADLSRNRSKRFCDTGNCANRAHVAAYRARRARAAG
ncbi:CGNR zinc finger domain-containing protein [Pseudonocardia sp. HH130630-07]|uniref:CGNR zinc finger domain-containing protein n=1 Tax=Pseudonocardia sp. HH130630-07 TaxID=1690815 RepID=UPI000814FC32|nr:CGNR zinc finger domain-containing protein [Pseudonocardia sp. HH130630-07]ANY06530.1 RNA-binding protein [Pseudonocardia sp. HH130630-07]